MYVSWNNFTSPIFYTFSYVKEQHEGNVLKKILDKKPVTDAWLEGVEILRVIDLLD